MTDLVERLRACDCGIHCKSGCIQEKAADEIERLRAALAASLSALECGGWQPVETAPRAEWVLVWRPASNVRDAAWCLLPPGPGFWTEGHGGPLDPPPTHWMPLPKPPSIVADK